MKIIDLSQVHEVNMTQFPGSPPVKIGQISNYNSDGFRLTDFHSLTHSGTHCDAPAHYISGAKMIDQMPLNSFIGNALLVDTVCDENREIPASILDGKDLKSGDILVLRSNMSKYWNREEYINDYPYISYDLAKKLVEIGIKALAIDFLSPDPLDRDRIHKILLGADIVIVENLNNLDKIPVDRFVFSAAPILIKNSEGSFARAYGIIE